MRCDQLSLWGGAVPDYTQNLFVCRPVRIIFFLMRYEGEASRPEERARSWCRYEDALNLVHFEDTRRVLMDAHSINPS